eukprot:GEZU01001012.1.p2 GENE.GEZU01001012.1~~GEZU01001012.1.p2  ORF type:complete len:116 (-),score=41.58 GEZU01001012.1:73-420(-)
MNDGVALQWIVAVANTIVHTFMYYYYMMQNLGVNVWWKKYITQMQIVQFLVDLAVSWCLPFVYGNDHAGVCSGNMFGFWFCNAVGISFVFLFGKFYFESYKKKPAVTDASKPKVQ